MARGNESFTYAGSGTSPTKVLHGGLYEFAAVSSSWGSGSAVLNQLGPDGTTFLSIATPLTANGGAMYYLPPGQYQIVASGATVSAHVVRVPIE